MIMASHFNIHHKRKSMSVPTKVSKYAVGLVVLGGVVWVISSVVYGAILAFCFPSCGSAALASGSTVGFPPQAVSDLVWEDFYSLLYTATIGIITIAIGLRTFKQGQKWGWYVVLVVVFAAFLTGLLDYLSWGGWYTFLFLGLLPFFGLVLSIRSFFPTKGKGRRLMLSRLRIISPA
jgi:hypothetical protein